jgi:hypothetical protein
MLRADDSDAGCYSAALWEETPVESDIGFSPQLARCLQLNALALAFSLAHTVADYGIIVTMIGTNYWFMTGYLGLSSAVYAWWGWSMARAVVDRQTALPSLLALSGFWAVLHGATFVWTSITNILADVIHFGSLIFGVWAAYATWRLLRSSRVVVARAN